MTRSSSETGIPVGIPVALSISGVNQIGSRPVSTRALKTDLCAVRETATF